MDKKIARCGEPYYWPAQAWIHAFCVKGKPCFDVAARKNPDKKDSLNRRRKGAYGRNRSYGVTEGLDDPVYVDATAKSVDAHVDVSVDASDVDAIRPVDKVDQTVYTNVDAVDAGNVEQPSTESAQDRAKRLKAERMQRYREKHR